MSEQNINITVGDTVPMQMYMNLEGELRRCRNGIRDLRVSLNRSILRDHEEALEELYRRLSNEQPM